MVFSIEFGLVAQRRTTSAKAPPNNGRSSVTPVRFQIGFPDNHHHHSRAPKSQVSLQPTCSLRHHAAVTIPVDTCDRISSRRPPSSSCWPQCSRDSRHPGSAIDDVRGRICGRGLPNGPAKCRASRRVRVCAPRPALPHFRLSRQIANSASIAMKDCHRIFRCCRT